MANRSLNRIDYKFYIRKAAEIKIGKHLSFRINIYREFLFSLTARIKRNRKCNTSEYIGIQL